MEIKLRDPVPHLRLFPILAKIPEVQILWVGPEVCSRHGMMTFLHNLRGTLSFFCYREIDAVTGDYVRKINEAALEVIRERNASCLILCTICQGAVLGTNVESLKKSITKESGVPVEYMITNRLYLHSVQKRRPKSILPEVMIYSFLEPSERDPYFSVNILDRVYGTEESDLHAFLRSAGAEKIRNLTECETREEYQQLSGAHLNVVAAPSMKEAAVMMEKKLGIPWADMSAVYDPDGLADQYEALRKKIGGDPGIPQLMHRKVSDKLACVSRLLEGHVLHMEPMGTDHVRDLSRWLRSAGIVTPEIAGWQGTGIIGGPGAPGSKEGRRRRRPPMGRPDGPGMPPVGSSPMFDNSIMQPRPVTYSACLRILDRIIDAAEIVL